MQANDPPTPERVARERRGHAPMSWTQAAASTDAVLAQIGLTDVADRLVNTYTGGPRRRLDLAPRTGTSS
ncbi:MAG: hypothetical protein ACRDN0_24110, partial [Trebonia sp.]